MRDIELVPAMAFGFVVGLLVAFSLRHPGLWGPLLAPALVVAGASVVVGWFAQVAVRRWVELSRIPLDHLSELCRRIDDIIDASLKSFGKDANDDDRHSPECLANLVRLSNELHLLNSMLRKTERNLESRGGYLESQYVLFKRYLTDNPTNFEAAVRAGGKLRAVTRAIHWELCQYIVYRGMPVGMFR